MTSWYVHLANEHNFVFKPFVVILCNFTVIASAGMKKYFYCLQHGTDEGWTNLQGVTIEGEGAWARSAKAVTHGIWIWNRPFIVKGVS